MSTYWKARKNKNRQKENGIKLRKEKKAENMDDTRCGQKV